MTDEKIERIGETRMMNCGMEATIISYRKSKDIDIRFKDGIIVTNKDYRNFLIGNIKHPNMRKKRKKSNPYGNYVNEKLHLQAVARHLGEVSKNKNGQMMTIIEYRKYENIDVQFEDGTIVKHARYDAFKNGSLLNPNAPLKIWTSLNEYTMLFYLSQLGFKKAPRDSLKECGFGRMELDAFHKEKKIAVEYDGSIHRKNTKGDIKKDMLCYNAGIELIRIREKLPVVSNYSKYYFLSVSKNFSKEYELLLQEIIDMLAEKYHMKKINIDFQNDKQTIIDNYNNWYSSYTSAKSQSHLGEQYLFNNNRIAIVVDQLPNSKVKIQLNDNTTKVMRYSDLKRRHQKIEAVS